MNILPAGRKSIRQGASGTPIKKDQGQEARKITGATR
jgi:hypothetical protein